MATARALMASEWPKFDLPKQHLVYLAINWRVAASPEAEAVLAELLDENGEFLNIHVYSRRKMPHHRVEMVRREHQDGEQFLVALAYDASGDWPPGEVPKSLQGREQLLDSLLLLELAEQARCSAEVHYNDASNMETVFPLPFDFGSRTDVSLPMDEIRGIRGVKLAQEGREESGYGFILDRPSAEELRLSVSFSMSAEPVEDVPERAVKTVVEIASRIVFPGRS